MFVSLNVLLRAITEVRIQIQLNPTEDTRHQQKLTNSDLPAPLSSLVSQCHLTQGCVYEWVCVYVSRSLRSHVGPQGHRRGCHPQGPQCCGAGSAGVWAAGDGPRGKGKGGSICLNLPGGRLLGHLQGLQVVRPGALQVFCSVSMWCSLLTVSRTKPCRMKDIKDERCIQLHFIAMSYLQVSSKRTRAKDELKYEIKRLS